MSHPDNVDGKVAGSVDGRHHHQHHNHLHQHQHGQHQHGLKGGITIKLPWIVFN